MKVYQYDLCFETSECINLQSFTHDRNGLNEAFKLLENLGAKVITAQIVSTKDYDIIYNYQANNLPRARNVVDRFS
jgi:hypothetical protein